MGLFWGQMVESWTNHLPEGGQDLSLPQRNNGRWRRHCGIKKMVNKMLVFTLCRSSFTAETKEPEGTVENFRFLNRTGKHSFLKDSSQCQDTRRVTNLKGLHYESVVEEAVFSNHTCPCSWKGTAGTPPLSVTEERAHQVHAFTFI